jgi:hypothetical protein
MIPMHESAKYKMTKKGKISDLITKEIWMMVMIDYDDENRDSKVLKMLIVTKLWIGEGILNQENLKAMQKRADAIKITSDLDFALSG